MIETLDLDIFHSLHAWFPFFIGRLRMKKVVTIYDLFVLTDKEFFAKRYPLGGLFRTYFTALTRRAVTGADLIVTVSEYSAKRIVELFPDAEGKIEVIYCAAGLERQDPAVASPEKAKGYLLYVGNCRSYKNIPLLIRGFVEYLRRRPESDMGLVIAGNDHCPHIRELAGRLGILERIRFILDPPDADLSELYARAVAFVMPSREEGFGIPVLEAMNAGIPVIVSDTHALVEVAGDAALVFDRSRPEALADAICQITDDDSLRRRLTERGHRRVEQFSWRRNAARLRECYAKLGK